MLASSYDPYAFMRNAYLQRREFQVSDGVASAHDEELEIFEDEHASTDTADGSRQRRRLPMLPRPLHPRAMRRGHRKPARQWGCGGTGHCCAESRAIAAILLAEVLLRAALLGHAPGLSWTTSRLPAQVYSLLLIWAGALATLTAVEGSSGRPDRWRWICAGPRPRTGWLAAHLAAGHSSGVSRRGGGDTRGTPELLQQVAAAPAAGRGQCWLSTLALMPAAQWRTLAGGSSHRGAVVALVVAAVVVLAIQPAGQSVGRRRGGHLPAGGRDDRALLQGTDTDPRAAV